MKFVRKAARRFKWEGIRGWAYNSKEDFPNATVAYVEVKGRHGKVKNTRSDRVYFVVQGRGEFLMEAKPVRVERSDVIIIPAGTPYDYQGRMRLVLVDTPAFEPGNEVGLE